MTKEKGQGGISVISGIMILLLVGAGAYYLGTRNDSSTKSGPLTGTQQLTQEPTAVRTSPTDKPVTIPTHWKQYTATDPDFGIKTAMSLPPGYSFRFSGSEFTIQNDSDATELWEYSTSVYRDNTGALKNHYDGSSRRAWYKKRLSEKQSTDKIMSVNEKPLGATTYLEITVATPSYDGRGARSGTKNGKHYVMVQNNILHMITPSSNKAYTITAQIPASIEPILASLFSSQTQ